MPDNHKETWSHGQLNPDGNYTLWLFSMASC